MARTILVLFRPFFDICLFRKRPQDLPASRELFLLVLLLYGVLSAVLSYSVEPFSTAVISGLVEAAMLLIITWMFLFLRSVPERWLQTSTALAGTGAFFSLVAFPLFYWRVFAAGTPVVLAFNTMLVILLILWNIGVMAFILRNALSSSYLLGVLSALTYIAIITYTLQAVLPQGIT